MTTTANAWGRGPGDRYDARAARFRPIFERIAAGTVARERGRRLPFEEIGWLKQARFGALRVPESDGGFGATLPELFALLAELATADSNLTRILRAPLGVVEDVLASRDGARRARLTCP